MIKELPFQPELCTGSSHQASLLGILYAYDECRPWIYSNYMQIFTWKDFYLKNRYFMEFYFNSYGDMALYEHSTCPWIRFGRIKRIDVVNHWNSFSSFIRERIDADEYIYVTMNTAELSSYGGGGPCHPLLIYGYNTGDNTVRIADNMTGGKYTCASVPEHEIEKAFIVPDDEDMFLGRTSGILTLKKLAIPEAESRYPLYSMGYKDWMRRASNAELKLNKIRQDISRYLCVDCPYEYLDNDIVMYGIECLQELIKYIDYAEENKIDIDYRSISTIHDHKVIMSKRIAFLSDMKLCDSSYRAYEDIAKSIYILRNMMIKYNMKKSIDAVKRIRETVKVAISEEKAILTDLVADLSKVAARGS